MQKNNKGLGMSLLLTGVFFILTGTAQATNGMKVIGVGPIQRSMGGATVGLPLDASTTITNPAGMSFLGRQVNYGITYFIPDVSYRATSSMGQVSQNDVIFESDAAPFVIPAFGIVSYKGEAVTLGFGAYGVSGMGVDYAKNLYNNVTYSSYTFMKFAPAVSVQVQEALSLGIAVNVDYAAMEYEAGTTAETGHNDGVSYGMGFTLGALYQATDLLSLGLAYESRQWFPDFEFNTLSGKDKLDFDQPQSISAGIGVRPSEKLRFAFDLTWIDWPQTNGKNQPAYTENSSGATPWNMNWSDQFVYKIGTEFDLNDRITLRAGYNYGKNPLDHSRPFENIAFPAIAEQHVTAGLGIRFDKTTELNLGVMFAPQVEFKTGNAAGQYIDSAKTSMSQMGVDLGITHRF